MMCSIVTNAGDLGYDACDLEEAEQKRCEVKIVSGQKEGKETCRAMDNYEIILKDAQFANGKLNGPLLCRDFNNQIYLQANYANGKLQGEHKDYSKTRHWKDIKEAWSVKYFENGLQVGMEFFADDKNNVLEFMPSCWEQGDRGTNFGFCLGLKYGKYDDEVKKHLRQEISKRFKEMNRDVEDKYTNGKIKFKVKIVDGRYDGEAQWFYEDGTPKSKILYKKGDPQKAEDFFESGKPKTVKIYKDNKLEKSEAFYENGKLSEVIKVSYESAGRREKIERFDDKGYRTSEMTQIYTHSEYWGILDGPYRIYGSKGTLNYEANYKLGKIDGKASLNYELEKEEELWEKGIRKHTIRFDLKTGKPIEKIEYMNDGSEKNRTKLDGKII